VRAGTRDLWFARTVMGASSCVAQKVRVVATSVLEKAAHAARMKQEQISSVHQVHDAARMYASPGVEVEFVSWALA
jgi:hypothetical protein